jgi:hypothetical protein
MPAERLVAKPSRGQTIYGHPSGIADPQSVPTTANRRSEDFAQLLSAIFRWHHWSRRSSTIGTSTRAERSFYTGLPSSQLTGLSMSRNRTRISTSSLSV